MNKLLLFSCVAAASFGSALVTNRPGLAIAAIGAISMIPIVIRLRVWRSLYAITLLLMLFAISSQPELAWISFYPRYAAAALLALVTYLEYKGSAVTLRALPKPARLLMLGMSLATATAAVSTTWSVDRLVTAQQAAALAALTVLLHGLVTRRWTERSLIIGDLAVAFWVSATVFGLGVLADFIGVGQTRAFGGRFQGFTNNPNMLAVLCVLAIPVGVFLYRNSLRKRYLIGLAPIATAMLMTESRTAFVALLIGLVWMLFRRGISTTVRAVGTVFALCVVTYLSGLFKAAISSNLALQIAARFTADEGGDALNGRPLAWAETIELVWQRPSTGFGYSAGPALFEQLRGSGMLAFGRDVTHNSYLQWLLETGAIGIPALILLVAACLNIAYCCGRSRANSGISWCLVAGLALQVTESAMMGTGQPYPFVFWLVAAAGSVLTKTNELEAANEPRPTRTGRG